MRSLVMSLLSPGLLKIETDYLRYLQRLNLVNNCLHVYSIHTRPNF